MDDIFEVELPTDPKTIADDILMHYGTKRHSGRYPWGSGDNPYQHSSDWLARVNEMKKEGVKDAEIAEFFGLGTVELRSYRSLAIEERKMDEALKIQRMTNEGMSPSEIGKKLGMNESSVRSKLKWLEKRQHPDIKSAEGVATYLKDAIDQLGGSIDVGEGVAKKLGVSQEKFEQALSLLENQGYTLKTGMIDRVTDPTSNNKITMKVLAKGELPNFYVREHPEDIHSLNELDTVLTEDGTKTRPSFVFPESMDPSRLQIRYAEEGGLERDGLIEIRRGVKDLDMGLSNYAQVRILVDGDRYLKGMAVYADDLPPGIDVRFNTNKKLGKPMRDVLKEVKRDKDGNIDVDNPFGSLIKEKGGQTYYDDPNGKYIDPETGKRQSLSLINKRAEEGDWDDWSDKVPSQFLSKQPLKLINTQLDISIKEREAEYNDILSVTNPTVKKKMLLDFADSCEKGSETLKAAAFPGQKYQVILPLTEIKDTEVYAPNFEDGSQVALVRYPHGGTFEIPILTVNNRNRQGKSMLGTTPHDAIGISSAVAGRLSGADFDGDTVQVIPLSEKVNIKSTPTLHYKSPVYDGPLSEFDAKYIYGTNDGKMEGVRYMKREEVDKNTGKVKTVDNTQMEMGKISNLITDMTIRNASREELARATAHSMVIIDAAKHKLDYKRSEMENGILDLKRKYQGKTDPETGRVTTPASTIISRAHAQASAPRTEGQPHIDPDTGKLVRRIDTRPNAKGEQRMVQSVQMRETDDAFTLVSDMNNPVEVAYAKYANKLKAMGGAARKDTLKIKEQHRDPNAARIYANEIASLKKKIEKAQSNQTRERWAHLLATQRMKVRQEDDPVLYDDKKLQRKIRQQYLTRAREEVGAKREKLTIEPKEWEAIQAGALGNTNLVTLMKYTPPEEIKKWAMPHYETGVTSNQVSMMKVWADNGYTNKQIATRLGISASTVSKYLKGKESPSDG